VITWIRHTLTAVLVRLFRTYIHELPSEIRTVCLIIENDIYHAIREVGSFTNLICLILF
jgi:hypothetical protein